MSKVPQIFVLGAGSMGCLVAHELKQAFGKQVNPILLFKTQKVLDLYNNEGSEITIIKSQNSNILTSKSRINGACKPPIIDNKQEIINNLILSTKTFQSFSALENYIPHLTKDSNILILQNGMGMVPLLTERFWPAEWNRPNIFQAISTHGAYKSSLNVVHHAAPGKLTISYIPRSNEDIEIPNKIPQFIDDIINTPNLNASYENYNSFLLIQMEKLIVNATINPITALLDCFNGDLLHAERISSLSTRIIKEATDCLFAEYKILQSIPEAESYLSHSRLLNTVLSMCNTTAKNSSSMREDVRHLNNTEIDYINGYIVKLGIKHNISAMTNKTIVDLVKNKLSIDRAIEKNATKFVVN
ncbi:ketopantoate reductase PanE/ApbA C terminal-domain-containing protein [Scheffersomyces amazonensis]|uniref:ketopantoate reductase PanE/ApbA C terminal-domain-containing protein n=1 Tax=Scheffersomyces amazonensis TaxID=1078765 RepID=UPI00315D4864